MSILWDGLHGKRLCLRQEWKRPGFSGGRLGLFMGTRNLLALAATGKESDITGQDPL